MKTNPCLKKHCYMCENFKAVKNEFEKTITSVCILYRKGIYGCCDVTLITPDIMLNGIDWGFKDENR